MRSTTSVVAMSSACAIFADGRRASRSRPPSSSCLGATKTSVADAPDCSKAARELGWRPRTSFADGLRKTVDWYRAVRSVDHGLPSRAEAVACGSFFTIRGHLRETAA